MLLEDLLYLIGLLIDAAETTRSKKDDSYVVHIHTGIHTFYMHVVHMYECTVVVCMYVYKCINLLCTHIIYVVYTYS